jgi:hypothetical protein
MFCFNAGGWVSKRKPEADGLLSSASGDPVDSPVDSGLLAIWELASEVNESHGENLEG